MNTKQKSIEKATLTILNIKPPADDSIKECLRIIQEYTNVFESLYDTGYDNAMEEIRQLQKQN